ncbi:hypothetical protein LPE509_02085 [Legionella pneumophila subsp. pneumophila LPE509]|nr:hypothetical protein LPE509_02085 [Legionella pneumophila subsp. pneumophila LPE509]
MAVASRFEKTNPLANTVNMIDLFVNICKQHVNEGLRGKLQ